MTTKRLTLVLMAVVLVMSAVDVVLSPRQTPASWASFLISRGFIVWAMWGIWTERWRSFSPQTENRRNVIAAVVIGGVLVFFGFTLSSVQASGAAWFPAWAVAWGVCVALSLVALGFMVARHRT